MLKCSCQPISIFRNRNQRTRDSFEGMADAGFLLPIPKLSLPKDRNMAEETMRALTVQIVSAHIASNTVSPADLPKLINDVHQALVKAGEPVPPLPSEHAVPVRQSVKADHLV